MRKFHTKRTNFFKCILGYYMVAMMPGSAAAFYFLYDVGKMNLVMAYILSSMIGATIFLYMYMPIFKKYLTIKEE